MKTLFFTIFILILASTSLFSQNEITSKIDTTILSERLSVELKDFKLKRQVEIPNTYQLPEFKSQLTDSLHFKKKKNTDKTIHSFDQQNPNQMPVVHPRGYWDTPIMVPDSTIDYKLQIQSPKSLK